MPNIHDQKDTPAKSHSSTQDGITGTSERIHTLEDFLARYPELNLTGKVKRVQLIAYGGFADIYLGTYVSNVVSEEQDGKEEEKNAREPVKVAIKSIRTFVNDNADNERVRTPFSLFAHYPIVITFYYHIPRPWSENSSSGASFTTQTFTGCWASLKLMDFLR